VTAGSPQVRAAALIRADIRKAVEDGAVGELPQGISFSVRANDLRLTLGVTITVYGTPLGHADTGEGGELRRKLIEIAGRHWQPPAPGFTDVEMLSGRGRDILDDIADETAQMITDDHIEERLQETLRRAGYARGDIPGRPKRKD
jgi:hypothetical protein